MSARWDAQQLVQPIAADKPCGDNLEDTLLLASFDAFRVFGQATPLDPAPDWTAVKDLALEALERSKDLRLLAYLAAAVLRTDGLPAFTASLTAAADWLDGYWDDAYPPVDGDAVLRRNALNCFADRMAIIDGLRRLPLAISREHGQYSLRDLDIAAGVLANDDEKPRDGKQVDAAFMAMPLEALQALEGSATAGVSALKRVEARMLDKAGIDAAPAFDGLAAQMVRMQRVLRQHIAVRTDGGAIAEPDGGADSEPPAAPVSRPAHGRSAAGPVGSREDAMRALDAVAEFFRRHEPSSPIPLLVDRAKRLVSKNFLEVLADIAPDAMAQARAAGGLNRE